MIIMHQPLDRCRKCGILLKRDHPADCCDRCRPDVDHGHQEGTEKETPSGTHFSEGEWVSIHSWSSDKEEMLGWVVESDAAVIRVNAYDPRKRISHGLQRITPHRLKRIGIRLNQEDRRELRRLMMDLALLTKDKEWWEELLREEDAG